MTTCEGETIAGATDFSSPPSTKPPSMELMVSGIFEAFSSSVELARRFSPLPAKTLASASWFLAPLLIAEVSSGAM